MTKKNKDQKIPPIIPATPTKKTVYRAAKSYRKAGLSFIPIVADGTKRPAWMLMKRVWCEESGKWKYPWSHFKSRQPTREEIQHWFADPHEPREFGLAIIGGAVSGGLEIIDCDNWDAAEQWMALVRKKSPYLIDKLVLVKSPRPGLHAYYRCAEFGGNKKLARIPDPEQDNKKPKTIIEIKGEGGYCLAPPSPASCHKSGRCYRLMGDKDFTHIPNLSPGERTILVEAAHKLNGWTEPSVVEPAPRRRQSNSSEDRPGDDFNSRADWAEILEPHGWKRVSRDEDGSERWRRPGKFESCSASANFAGSNLLYVFSSNAHPFDEATSYTKFHAYTLFNHKGDFTAAARQLARNGYGRRRPSRAQPEKVFARYAGYKLRSRR
jgi:hypothetical protein